MPEQRGFVPHMQVLETQESLDVGYRTSQGLCVPHPQVPLLQVSFWQGGVSQQVADDTHSQLPPPPQVSPSSGQSLSELQVVANYQE